MEGHWLVKALYSYNPTEDYCIQLTEGETYKVVNDDPANEQDEWIKIMNSDGESGFAPKNYVQEIELEEPVASVNIYTSTPASISMNRNESNNIVAEILESATVTDWSAGEISRINAEIALRKDGHDGAFLIRNSASGEGFSLSVYSTAQNSIRHYRILVNDNGQFYITERHAFPTLGDLVSYYKEFEAGLIVKITNAVKPDKIYCQLDPGKETEQPVYETLSIYEEGAHLVRAINAVKKTTEETLKIDKGDLLRVLDANHYYWLKVQNYQGSIGYVPKIDVEEVLKEDKPSDWFVDKMDRTEASVKLEEDGRDGAFLVRTNEANEYVLSLFSKNKGVQHYRIHHIGDSKFYLKEKRKFCTLTELIHYHQHNGSDLTTRLKHVPKAFVKTETIWNNRLWKLNAEDITITQKISHGHFGEVFLGKLRNEMDVAIKRTKQGAATEDDFLDEAKLMTTIHHKNLVQLHGIYTAGNCYNIVMEYMSKGSLLEYLKNNRQTLFRKLADLHKICVDVCSGMEYLESKKCIHRDVAARNCLVGDNLVVKLCDFGLSRFILDDEYTSSVGGHLPLRWMPLEVLLYRDYSSKSDVWSYGVLMWEVYTGGEIPYTVTSTTAVCSLLESGQRLKKPEMCPSNIFQIMSSCWLKDPKRRPSFQEIKNQLLKK